jgi:hypothetical protein
VPTNVTAKANRSTGSYATNTAVVTTSNPAIISGPRVVCSGASTYTVNNLTCGASVTWSLSPGANGTLSTTSGPTTILTTPPGQQGLTVIANVTSSCVSKTLSQPVSITTTAAPTNLSIWGDTYCQDGRIVAPQYFYASADNATDYFWSWRSSSGSTGTFTSHSDAVSRKFGLGSWTVYCYAANACGQTPTDEIQFNINPCSFAAASENENASVAVSPNPASNVVVITAKTTNSALKVQDNQNIREVRIIDKTGRLLRKQTFPAGTTRATINVESFKPDIYILQIGDGKTFKTQKIKVAR